MSQLKTHRERAQAAATAIRPLSVEGTVGELFDQRMVELTAPIIARETWPGELLQAAQRLFNEVYASLGAFELEMREAIGNTNYSILEQRADELKFALALYPEKETPE